MGRGPLKWSYGVTTVPSRRADLLPRTLASLKAGGFDAPRLFADGCSMIDAQRYREQFNLEVTPRAPAVRAFGNFMLSLWELWLREPTADRFAIFQDDLLCVRNLRAYLDRAPNAPWGEEGGGGGYLNLYTFRENDPDVAAGYRLRPLVQPSPGWCGGWRTGFFDASQKGRGAVGLVFDRAAVLALLSSRHIAERPMDFMRGHRALDGGVVTALAKAGIREVCHWPSPLQHTGDVSAIGNESHAKANSFPGEGFDALQWLPG